MVTSGLVHVLSHTKHTHAILSCPPRRLIIPLLPLGSLQPQTKKIISNVSQKKSQKHHFNEKVAFKDKSLKIQILVCFGKRLENTGVVRRSGFSFLLFVS